MRRLTKLKFEIYHDCQDFAFHDYPELARNYNIYEPEFNQMFPRMSEIELGGRIAYIDLEGTINHFGLCTNRGTIVSKNGIGGKIYEHYVEDSGWAKGIIAIYFVPFQSGFNEDVRKFLNNP